jgi:peptide/nickel transport system permease protein
MTIVYPFFSPFSWDETDALHQQESPGWPHVFGTGDLGEDIFAQVMYGGRTSLMIGVLAALVSVIVGSLSGAVAGYRGGWVDSLISRVTDIFLTLPGLATLAALAAAVGKLSIPLIVLIIAAISWMSVTRLVRAEFISLKERDFVQAARASGVGSWRIIWRHILPGAVPVIVVSATLLVGTAIILEATLSFLGIGLSYIDNPSWGNIIQHSQEGLLNGRWWGVVFPGLIIVLTVLFVSFLGDALRDALDPHGESLASKDVAPQSALRGDPAGATTGDQTTTTSPPGDL